MRSLACAGLALVLVAGAAACSGPTPPSATGPSSPSAAPAAAPATAKASPPADPRRLRVQAVIDLGGAEAYGLAVRPDAVWAVAYQAGTLSRVDPASGTVTGTVHIGSAASVLAALDSLWVAAYAGASSTVVRVDPATGAVVATIAAGEVCCDLTVGAGSVWAVDPGGAILRIDPARNAVTQRIAVPVDRNAHTNVVYAGDSLWISSDTTPLRRIRIGSGRIEALDVGGGVPFLAQDGLVWGAAPDRLWAVDQSTGRMTRQIPLANSTEVLSLGLGAGAIWVGIRRPGRVGAVLRLDPATGALLDEVRDISIPARIELGFGSVWVTDSGSRSLYRLAPPV